MAGLAVRITKILNFLNWRRGANTLSNHPSSRSFSEKGCVWGSSPKVVRRVAIRYSGKVGWNPAQFRDFTFLGHTGFTMTGWLYPSVGQTDRAEVKAQAVPRDSFSW